MNKIIVLLSFLLMGNFVFSQSEIKGNVLDKKNKESMVGVSVYIPELQRGTFTDKEGNYRLNNLPKGLFTIQFSYMGYKTQNREVKIGDKTITLNIMLMSTYIYTPEVIVTAMGYTSQHENAIKVESIKAQDLNHSATINIMNKLSEIPGLNMISQGPAISSPNIRGLSLSNVLVLNNGFRMNNYQFSEHHPYLISNYGISKVELIKGPASLLYGSDAVGGVINFIEEQPAAVGRIESDINTAYYSATNGYETNIGVKAHGKKYYWGIRTGMQEQGDFIQGNGHLVPNSRSNDRNVQLSTGMNTKLGDFSLKYSFKKSKIGLTTPQAILFVKDRGYNNEMWFQNLDYHQLSSKNRFYFNKVKLESNFSFQTNRRRIFGLEKYIVDMRLQNFDYEFKARYKPNNNYQQIVGIQGNYTQNILANAPIVVIPNYFQNDISVFTLLQKDFFSKLHLQAGIRYDYRKLYIPKINTGISNSYSHLDTTYQSINFTAGATYEINDQLFLRLNTASAFRTPNVAELTQDGVHETRYERGNIHLKSQQSHEADLGIHFHSTKFSYDLSLFYNQIGHYIYLAPTTDTASNGMFIFQYKQSNAKLYGFESGLNYVPSRHFNFKANYAFTKGIQDNGEYLPFIPQHKFQSSLNINFKDLPIWKHNYFEIGGLYAFQQKQVPSEEKTSAAYFLLNAGLGTTLKIGEQRFNLSIFANNLLNTTYVDHLSELKSIGYYDMGRNISIKLTIPLEGKYNL